MTSPEQPETVQVYRIKGWQQHFESAKSRTYRCKSQAYMPTKQGLGYKRLMRNKDGAAIFGAWCALVQLVSRQEIGKARQGYLTDTGLPDGQPLSIADISLCTMMPEKAIRSMLVATHAQGVEWLEVTEQGIPEGYRADTTGIPQGGIPLPLPLPLPSHAAKPSACAYSVGFLRFWTAYPRKKSKADAFRAWESAKDKPDTDTVIAAIEAQVRSAEWTRENGRYIPHPATWINRKCWDDQPTEQPKASGGFVEY